ncbi:hypothetical protein BDV98DRAFT_471256, partial [Pterulicium gracile]
AVVKLKTFTLLVKFAPTHYRVTDDSAFTDHSEAELINSIPTGSILKTQWVKRPERRSPHQQSAHLLVTFIDADAANVILQRGSMVICSKSCPAEKDLSEPLRCLRCQKYGHMPKTCQRQHGVSTCGRCGEGHDIKECENPDKRCCVSCASDEHSSNDRACPSF